MTKRLLACDLDLAGRDVLGERLGSLGWEVTFADDCEDALGKLQAETPDAVVSDVLVPNLGGFGLCAAIRRDPRWAALPVVLISSSLEREDHHFAEQVGADALVLRTPDYQGVIDGVLQVLVRSEPAGPPEATAIATNRGDALNRWVPATDGAALDEHLARRSALQAAELEVLSAVSEVLSRSVADDVPLEEVFASCLDAGCLFRGAFYLRKTGGSLHLATTFGFDAGTDPIGLTGHETLLSKALAAGTPQPVPARGTTPSREASDFLAHMGVDHALLVPVTVEGKALGLLAMGSQDQQLSDDDWFSFARTVGSQLGQALALGRAVARIKASEDRVKRVLHENELILESAGEGILGLDAEGRVTFANSACFDLLGYFSHEIVGQVLHDLIHRRADGTPMRAEQCLVTETIRTGLTHRMVEDAFLRKDRRLVDVEFTSTPIRESGRLAGAVLVIKDIGERKRQREEMARQQEALHQSEKLAAMASLVAGVAHELNNPLSVLMGQASLLARTAEGGPLAGRAEKIVRAAERCARIVRNFLALARQQAPQRQTVHLNEIASETVELLAYQLRVDGVDARMDLAPDVPDLWADPFQIQQVVVNLITNAQAAMRQKPAPRLLTVASSFHRDIDRVRLTVTDTGPGIPLEVRPRLFEPFFTTKPLGEGTGLGLSLCRGIVTDHGGEIRFDSEVGAGTSFIVDLPPGPEAGVPAAEAAPVPQARTKAARILVVDDEPAFRELLVDLLTAEGHGVETAEDGAEALEKARRQPFDLAISDLKMPVMDGLSFYRSVEKEIPDLAKRFVFITGDVLSPQTRDFLESASRPTLPKPFEVSVLHRMIAALLRS